MSLKSVLPGKLGFGAAPPGNMFRDIPEDEALTTVQAAWDDCFRYFDNAPFYGAGLAELRMGAALAGKPRDEYAISTKGRRCRSDANRREGWKPEPWSRPDQRIQTSPKIYYAKLRSRLVAGPGRSVWSATDPQGQSTFVGGPDADAVGVSLSVGSAAPSGFR